MNTSADYILDFTQPPTAPVRYDFELGQRYWTEIAGDEIRGGHVCVVLQVKPMRGVYELFFSFVGEVEVECDRCLSPLFMPIDLKQEMTLELGDETDDSDERVIFLDRLKPVYDLSWLMYELIALSLPLKRVHADGECDPEMTKYLCEQPSESERRTLADSPQWQQMKERMKNKNNHN